MSDDVLTPDELRGMFMQRAYTHADVERLLISHAALVRRGRMVQGPTVKDALREAQAQVFAAKCSDDSSRWGEQCVNIKARHLDALIGMLETKG